VRISHPSSSAVRIVVVVVVVVVVAVVVVVVVVSVISSSNSGTRSSRSSNSGSSSSSSSGMINSSSRSSSSVSSSGGWSVAEGVIISNSHGWISISSINITCIISYQWVSCKPLRLVVGVSSFSLWSSSRHWWGSTVVQWSEMVDRIINGDVGGGIVVMDNLQDGRVCVSYLASCCVG